MGTYRTRARYRMIYGTITGAPMIECLMAGGRGVSFIPERYGSFPWCRRLSFIEGVKMAKQSAFREALREREESLALRRMGVRE